MSSSANHSPATAMLHVSSTSLASSPPVALFPPYFRHQHPYPMPFPYPHPSFGTPLQTPQTQPLDAKSIQPSSMPVPMPFPHSFPFFLVSAPPLHPHPLFSHFPNGHPTPFPFSAPSPHVALPSTSSGTQHSAQSPSPSSKSSLVPSHLTRFSELDANHGNRTVEERNRRYEVTEGGGHTNSSSSASTLHSTSLLPRKRRGIARTHISPFLFDLEAYSVLFECCALCVHCVVCG
jgi:hypothetical protein